MTRSRSIWLLVIGLLALAQISTGVPATGLPGAAPPVADVPSTARSSADLSTGDDAPVPSVAEADDGASRLLRDARAVQAATRDRLGVADQPRCADASFVSYRRSDQQPGIADQWY